MTHEELVDHRLSDDCRDAMAALGRMRQLPTEATWINDVVIQEQVPQEGNDDGTR